MKQWILKACFLLWIPSYALFSQQLSGTLENTLQVTQQEGWQIDDKVQLNLKFALALDSGLSFSLMGYATYDSQNSTAITADLQRLKIQWESSDGGFQVKTGRLLFLDNTGMILNQNLDGFQARLILANRVTLESAAAYTGLTFDRTATLVKTIKEYNQDLFLSTPRVVGQLKGSWENAQGNSFYLGALGQMGLQDSDRDYLSWYGTGGGTLSVQDWILKIDYAYNGGTTPILYGLDSQQMTIMAHLLQAGLSYYPSSLRKQGIRISLKGLYTSGDGYDVRMAAQPGSYTLSPPPETSELFTPISKTTLGGLIETLPGNIIRGTLSIRMTPIKGKFGQNILECGISGDLFLRPVHGPINVSGLNPLSDKAYLGTEINGEINFRPMSDLGIKLQLSAFLPDVAAGGAFEGSRDFLEWDSGLYLSLAF